MRVATVLDATLECIHRRSLREPSPIGATFERTVGVVGRFTARNDRSCEHMAAREP
ncbi:MAG TPA: hypothetical protein VFU07_07500 [Candidatus Lumbricidophila sp.]|nr:hypothetical protein [Candidatus Lumbricidophila sp.]